MAEPTDAELWHGVAHTVRQVLLPALGDDWARAAAIQLVGVAEYAAGRRHGRDTANAAELAAVLATIATNALVARHPYDHTDVAQVMSAAGAILAEAVDDEGPGGEEIRAVLRPVVVRQLDEELESTGPMIPYFRGQLDG